MVWGGITAHGRTPLLVVARNLTSMCYRDEIMSFRSSKNVAFQQDNARPHVARVVRDYLTQQNVDLATMSSSFTQFFTH